MDTSTIQEKTLTITIDEIPPYIGEFGRFQKWLICITAVIVYSMGFQLFLMYFCSIIPPWECISNSSVCTFNVTLPSDDMRRCNISRKEWKYTEPTDFSLATQFDIDCDEQWLLQLTSSMFFIGWGFGAIAFGWLGDRYGRKTFLFPVIITIFVVCIVSVFMPSIYPIIACRFICGFGYPVIAIQLSIINAEFQDSKHRPTALFVGNLGYPVSFCMLALKAKKLQNWRLLCIVCTVPYLWILAFFFIVPESVRWMLVRGRKDEALDILRKIARWNKRTLPGNIDLVPVHRKPKSSNACTISDAVVAVRSRKPLYEILVQGLLWFSGALCLFGLQFAADDLGGSIYRDYALLSMTEVPGALGAMFVCNRFGRKTAILTCLLLAGLVCVTLTFVAERDNLSILKVALGMVGITAITGAHDGLYVWSAEIIPTNIRSKCMGFLQVCARVGASIAPFVTKALKPFGRFVPFVAMACPALISALLGLYLPETKDRLLLHCADDVQNIKPDKSNENEAFEMEAAG